MRGAPPSRIVAKRRELVHAILTDFPAATLESLASVFGCSHETIRKDVGMLRDWGHLDNRPPGRKPKHMQWHFEDEPVLNNIQNFNG